MRAVGSAPIPTWWANVTGGRQHYDIQWSGVLSGIGPEMLWNRQQLWLALPRRDG